MPVSTGSHDGSLRAFGRATILGAAAVSAALAIGFAKREPMLAAEFPKVVQHVQVGELRGPLDLRNDPPGCLQWWFGGFNRSRFGARFSAHLFPRLFDGYPSSPHWKREPSNGFVQARAIASSLAAKSPQPPLTLR